MPSEEIMSREAMQIALDALEANLGNWAAKTKAVEVLRQALGAEQKTAVSPGKGTGFNYFRASAITVLRQAQEPVAWASSLDFDDDDQEIIPAKDKGKLGTSNCDIPLYTAPKQWVGLTDEEIAQGLKESWVTEQAWQSAVWWAEAKLKEKNHG
jgi:hypothetical protein